MTRDRSPDPRDMHERAPRTRFSDRVADYVRYRPGYPPAAIDAMLDGLAPERRIRACDVGAGTGIMTRLLARRGVDVRAIEPNPDMRRAGERWVRMDAQDDGGSLGEVTWHAGQAVATGVADGGVDLVVCAQSYHWFERVGVRGVRQDPRASGAVGADLERRR